MGDHPQMSPRAMIYQITRLASDLTGERIGWRSVEVKLGGPQKYPLWIARVAKWETEPRGTSTQAIDDLLQALEADHAKAYP